MGHLSYNLDTQKKAWAYDLTDVHHHRQIKKLKREDSPRWFSQDRGSYGQGVAFQTSRNMSYVLRHMDMKNSGRMNVCMDEDMDKAGWAALIYLLADIAPTWLIKLRRTFTATDVLGILYKDSEHQRNMFS